MTDLVKKNILITGGVGFIGSHLAERILQEDREVTVIDNLSTGRIENIKHLEGNKKFKFIKDTILNKKTMRVLIEHCDAVYHLAAAVGVKLIVDDPVHTIETNIYGTEVLLKLANEFKKPVFIASSSEVYGKSENVPFTENDDTVFGATNLPRWSYGCSKAIDEFLALAYHKQFGLDIVVGRFFNTIGPRQSGQYGMVVPRFIEAAIKGENLKVYGNGSQSRCFCYVDDVIDAMTGLMKADKAIGGVFNIGSTEEISIKKLAEKIIELTQSKSKIELVPYEKAYGKNFDDMARRVPSIRKIKALTGFEPKIPLKKSLELIISNIDNK